MTAPTGLPVALLVIYITLSFPTLYIAVKHGLKHGAIIGWLFLFAFCTLRIIASALETKDPNSASAALIASIGLSPLLIATCDVLHEARVYIIPKSSRPLDARFLGFYHVLISTAIALAAAGASKLDKTGLTPKDMYRRQTLVRAGMVLLLLGWVALLSFAPLALFQASPHESKRLTTHTGGKQLLLAATLSLPFIGIRVLERLVYFFTNK
ncbi:hypothetical protein AAE478_010484 [Parahypoxylon ruwenzoriense]